MLEFKVDEAIDINHDFRPVLAVRFQYGYASIELCSCFGRVIFIFFILNLIRLSAPCSRSYVMAAGYLKTRAHIFRTLIARYACEKRSAGT